MREGLTQPFSSSVDTVDLGITSQLCLIKTQQRRNASGVSKQQCLQAVHWNWTYLEAMSMILLLWDADSLWEKGLLLKLTLYPPMRSYSLTDLSCQLDSWGRQASGMLQSLPWKRKHPMLPCYPLIFLKTIPVTNIIYSHISASGWV